jgi:hypothetical protein
MPKTSSTDQGRSLPVGLYLCPPGKDAGRAFARRKLARTGKIARGFRKPRRPNCAPTSLALSTSGGYHPAPTQRLCSDPAEPMIAAAAC